jgi:hypothetical protein
MQIGCKSVLHQILAALDIINLLIFDDLICNTYYFIANISLGWYLFTSWFL